MPGCPCSAGVIPVRKMIKDWRDHVDPDIQADVMVVILSMVAAFLCAARFSIYHFAGWFSFLGLGLSLSAMAICLRGIMLPESKYN